MNVLTKIRLLAHIARWRMTWNRRDTRFAYAVPGNPKFMCAADAVKLIRDGDVVATSGLGSNQWCNIINWAVREAFQEAGHPRDLTYIAIGGLGGRGRVPGSVEEVGLPGLCTRFFTGHTETFKSILRLADAGQCELQCITQGALAFLIEAQGRGEDSFAYRTGVGTFIDPRTGRGTPVVDPAAPQWVEAEGDTLRFRLPKINVAVFNAPAADRKGNIYVKNCSMIAESLQIARAARRNGGKVIVNVGLLVDEGYDEIFMPADAVDAIVAYPGTDQAGSVRHTRYWPMFTTHSDIPPTEAVARLKFANQTLGITPRRYAVDNALARLAASIFAEHAPRGSLVNIGVGLPEEVCRLIVDAGLMDHVKFFTESGVIGGLPAPGVFFGAGLCPERIVSSVDVFHMVYKHLDASVLGMLQADSDGNVNVSKRGEGAINYVGAGGFIDFSMCADLVIFVSSWMIGGQVQLQGGNMTIARPGRIKFMDKVDEITFNGREALATGKKIFYVTNVGVFQLTSRGMELVRVMPGIDVQKDIIAPCPMRIYLPDSGHVPVVPPEIVTGNGFRLTMG